MKTELNQELEKAIGKTIPIAESPHTPPVETAILRNQVVIMKVLQELLEQSGKPVTVTGSVSVRERDDQWPVR